MLAIKKIKYQYQGNFNPQKLAVSNIDRLSTQMVSNHSKLLELGCATGFMSQYFKNKKNCSVYGVDISKAALNQAKKHCQVVIQGDLDKPQVWKDLKKHQPFDLVFASAIIEHLKDENQFLQRLRTVLKSEGELIITTPNVAHWRNRLNLVLGNWNYQEYGLLDKTHLRFFTYHTFQTLLKKNKFKIKDIKIDQAGGIKYLNFIAKHFPNFYAHQIVIKAQKA